MIRTTWRAVGMLVLIGLSSCRASPSDPGNVVRTGATTGGRKFAVVQDMIAGTQELSVITVRIEGEADVVLTERNFAGAEEVKFDSIMVSDYPGPPPLVRIDWNHATYSLDSGTYYHYLLFPRGQAANILLRGSRASYYTGHYAFSWTAGDYQLAYSNQVAAIQEHWITGGDSGVICKATETRFARSYQVNAANVTLLGCERFTRAVEVVFGGGPCAVSTVRNALDNTAWEAVTIPAEQARVTCAALDPP